MNIFRVLFQNNIPRWIIFFIDIVICTVSLVLAYLIRFNFDVPEIEIVAFPKVYLWVLSIRAISFLITKTHKGMVKYTSSKDAQRIFVGLSMSGGAFVLINLIYYYFVNHSFPIPFSIIIIDFMLTLFLMVALRVLFKALYTEIVNPFKEKRNVIIFGAGEAGIIAKRTLDRDAGLKYKVLAFIDDDVKKS